MSPESSPAPAALPPAPEPAWSSAPRPDPDRIARLRSELSLPATVCSLLAVRGYDDPEEAKGFLRPLLDRLSDPEALAGMEAAAERVSRAVEAGETILVHGDYDVDGISGTALLARWIRELGGRVRPFVPERLRDGYDFGPSGIEAAADAGAGLVVTVDCGIRAHDTVAEARSRGIDVVITDHHAPGDTLPDAVAVVNPSRADCPSPVESLSGTGVAYKLCQLLGRRAGADDDALHEHLDLVALATVADLVPLQGENRILARYGIKALRRTRKAGLRALIRQAGVEPDDVDAGRIGFVLGPRINAAGRIGEAGTALRLLLTEDPAEAAEVAAELEETNERRREEDQRILAEALDRLAEEYDPDRDYGVVLASEGWHPGVIGIVASRLVDRIHRPVVMVSLDGDEGRGSARSIGGFHLAKALEACREHLTRFGGHARAAGMDLTRSSVEDFRRAFREEARRRLEDVPLRPSIDIDLELSFDEATWELHRYLKHFGPFGIGNPRPVFLARGVEAARRPRVVGSGHLKLDLARDGHRLEAIGFGLAERVPPDRVADGPLDAVFQLRENVYRGQRTLQARLLDLRPADGPDA